MLKNLNINIIKGFNKKNHNKNILIGYRKKQNIINIKKILTSLNYTRIFLQNLPKTKKILFICLHPKFESITKKFANKTNNFYITSKWIPGTLTNKEIFKKHNKINGIPIQDFPDVIFFVHPYKIKPILKELKQSHLNQIPTIGILNSKKQLISINYPIYSNTNSIEPIYFILKFLKKYIKNEKKN